MIRRKKFELWAPAIIRELQRRSVSTPYSVPLLTYSILDGPDIGFSYSITDGTNQFGGDVAILSSYRNPTEVLTVGRGDATVIVSLDGLVAKFEELNNLPADSFMYQEFGAFKNGEKYPASRVVPALLDFFFKHYDIEAGQRELARRLETDRAHSAAPHAVAPSAYRGPPLRTLPDMTPRGTR